MTEKKRRLFRFLLKRFQTNEATQEERDLLDAWYQSFGIDYPDDHLLKRKEIRNSIFQEIHNRLTPHEENVDNSISKRKSFSVFHSNFIRIAAVLVVVSMLGFIFWGIPSFQGDSHTTSKEYLTLTWGGYMNVHSDSLRPFIVENIGIFYFRRLLNSGRGQNSILHF